MTLNTSPDEGLAVLGVLAALSAVAVASGLYYFLH